MTVKELLDQKYLKSLKTMNLVTWRNIEAHAKETKQHIAQVMYMGLEITHNDIKANGGYAGELYAEIDRMHKAKFLASNKHRQGYGHVTKYWLTKKGFKAINADGSIVM